MDSKKLHSPLKTLRRHMLLLYRNYIFDRLPSIFSLCFGLIYFHYTFFKVIINGRNNSSPLFVRKIYHLFFYYLYILLTLIFNYQKKLVSHSLSPPTQLQFIATNSILNFANMYIFLTWLKKWCYSHILIYSHYNTTNLYT